MGPLEAIGLLLISFGVGIVSAMIGLGGGFLVVPVLVLLYNLPAQEAAGTSLTMIIFTALSSTVAYVQQRRVDYLLGVMLITGTIPGAIAGAYATKFISSAGLSSLFGIFLIIVAARMLWSSRRNGAPAAESSDGDANSWRRALVDSKGQEFQYRVRVMVGIPLSILAGFASGFFGIGGGAVMVPVMNVAMGVPMHLAVATSMFLMIFTSISGVATHLALGNVLAEYALFLAIGVVAGAQIGARAARRLRASHLGSLFGIVLIIIGARMALEYLLK